MVVGVCYHLPKSTGPYWLLLDDYFLVIVISGSPSCSLFHLRPALLLAHWLRLPLLHPVSVRSYAIVNEALAINCLVLVGDCFFHYFLIRGCSRFVFFLVCDFE